MSSHFADNLSFQQTVVPRPPTTISESFKTNMIFNWLSIDFVKFFFVRNAKQRNLLADDSARIVTSVT